LSKIKRYLENIIAYNIEYFYLFVVWLKTYDKDFLGSIGVILVISLVSKEDEHRRELFSANKMMQTG